MDGQNRKAGGNKARAASLKLRQSCIKNNKEAKQIKRAHAAGKERGRRDVAASDNGALANPIPLMAADFRFG